MHHYAEQHPVYLNVELRASQASLFFFLTANVMHVGPVPMIITRNLWSNSLRVIRVCQRPLTTLNL